jgi:hypothetical protein
MGARPAREGLGRSFAYESGVPGMAAAIWLVEKLIEQLDLL